ncbi:MAG: DMT family transporter [Thioalkalispiraceae bacterium]|jgi:drug/metabolite transporter (DMT)-like permease
MKALILLLISGVLAGGVFITGKQASSEQISPLSILFWQISGGALVVWIASLPSRRFPIWNKQHVRYYLIGGLLGISLPYVLAFIVLQQLQVGIVGLLTALSPIITYAMARMLGQEPGHPLRLLGLIVGLGGVALLVMPDDTAIVSEHWSSMLLALAIPVTLAASNIYRSRYWPGESRAMPLVIGMLTVQSACLFVLNILLGNFHIVLPAFDDTSLVLAVLGLMAGASYLTSFTLLRVGGPVYLSQMGYVITAVTMLAGVLMWDERYHNTDLISMGLILSGVLLTTLTQIVQQAKVPTPVISER